MRAAVVAVSKQQSIFMHKYISREVEKVKDTKQFKKGKVKLQNREQ